MHILGGLLLLVVAFGVLFFIYQANVLSPVGFGNGSTTGIWGPANATSSNSEYFHEVRVQFVSLGAGLDQPMILSLTGQNSAKHEGITVSGWTIKTGKGTYPIPKATNLYSPSVQGTPPEDIYLRKGGTINFYSAKNTQSNYQAIRSGAGEWQIWIGKEFLPAPHGTVILRDARGKTVDQYEY